MTSRETQLLTLIRLLEGDLPVEQGVAVRERLATDAAFLKRWQVLANAVQTVDDELPEGARPTDLDFADCESVAAFVEGALPSPESTAFEQQCWQRNSALREVWSTYRAFRAEAQPEARTPATARQITERQITERLTAIALRECIEPAEAAPTPHAVPETQPANGRTHNRKPRVRLKQLPVNAVAPRSHEPRWKTRTLVGISTTAAVFVGLTVWIIARATQDPPGALPQERRQAEAPRPQDHQHLPNNPREENTDLRKTPDITPPQRVPEPSRVVEHDPVPPNRIPQQPVQDVPLEPERPVAARPVWSDVSGVIAVRNASNARWRGLLAEPERANTKDLTLRTLPNSWLRGQIAGLELVLAADSEIELGDLPPQRATNARAIHLQMRSGHLAIGGLRRNDQVVIASDTARWEIRATADDTAVGLVMPDVRSRELLTWQGTVEVGGQQVSAGESATWNGRAFVNLARIREPHHWRQAAPRKVLSLPLAARLNRSADLLQSLSQVNSSQQREIAMACNFSFKLDPVDAVPRAAAAHAAVRRDAAYDWLLAAVDDNQTNRQVWRAIAASTATGTPRLMLRKWFLVAQGQARPGLSLLAELSNGLSPRQPLFVRHCAIRLLRRLSGLPLSEYQPLRPTSATIDSVRQKLRRATNNGRARMRKPQRDR